MIQVSKIFSAFAAVTMAFAVGGCATSRSEKKELSGRDRALMLIQVANAALSEGDPTSALVNLAQAEKEETDLPELHHSKALAYHLKKDPALALAAAKKAVELKPDYSDANNTLGKLLMDQGKYDEATQPLIKAANDSLYREGFKSLTNLGILYYRRGKFARADEYLTRAIAAAPAQSCVAYYYRGHLRLRESRFQDAVKDYDNAGRNVCAGFADAHLALGIAYEQSKQFELARKKYLEVQSRYPNTQVAEQAVNHLRFLP